MRGRVSPLVIPAKAGIRSAVAYARPSVSTVIPAKAGIRSVARARTSAFPVIPGKAGIRFVACARTSVSPVIPAKAGIRSSAHAPPFARRRPTLLACEDNLSFMERLPDGRMKLVVTLPNGGRGIAV